MSLMSTENAFASLLRRGHVPQPWQILGQTHDAGPLLVGEVRTSVRSYSAWACLRCSRLVNAWSNGAPG